MTRNFFFEINLHKVSQMDYILVGREKKSKSKSTTNYMNYKKTIKYIVEGR